MVRTLGTAFSKTVRFVNIRKKRQCRYRFYNLLKVVLQYRHESVTSLYDIISLKGGKLHFNAQIVTLVTSVWFTFSQGLNIYVYATSCFQSIRKKC